MFIDFKIMKKLTIICGIFFSFVSHADPVIQSWETQEGARVYLVENHQLPMIDLAVDFVAGSVFDSKMKPGTAFLTNHSLKLGSSRYTEEQLALSWVDLGIESSHHVMPDYAGVRLRLLSEPKIRDQAIKVLSDMIANPVFPEKLVQREKKRLIAATADRLKRPDVLASQLFKKTIYSDHPYGYFATIKSVQNLQVSDLHEFHQQFYQPNNAVISIVGDITKAEAVHLVSRIVGRLLNNKTSSKASFPVIPAVMLPKKQFLKLKRSFSQNHVYLGMPSLKKNDPDRFALQLANYILGGGGFQSRLMNEIREKRGFVYNISSTFESRMELGPFKIAFTTKPSQADEAIKLAYEMVKDFLREGPTDTEVDFTKKSLLSSFDLQLDSNAKQLSFLQIVGVYQLPLNYLSIYRKKIQSLTSEEVKAAFRRHVRLPHLVVVSVGQF